MPQPDEIIPVEFRFPVAGVTTEASRDRMVVSEAEEIVNMRRRQRPIVGVPAFSQAPRVSGGRRGGLEAWNNTVFGPAHINAFYSESGQRIAVVIGQAGANVVWTFEAVAYAGAVTSATWTPALFPVSTQRSDAFGSTLYVVGPNNGGQPVGAKITRPAGVTIISPWSLPANMFGTSTLLQGPTSVVFFRGSALVANRYVNQYAVSRVGNPDDFNYGVAPLATAPYLGNPSAKAGVPGEAILELIPEGNDAVLMMGASSVSRMLGDPRDGGRVVLASDRVGVSNSFFGTPPYTKDSQGRVFFLASANRGLFVIEPGGKPVSVSDARAKGFFNDFFGGGWQRSLAYDPSTDSVVMGSLNASQSLFGYSTLHYHIPTGTWSVDQHPAPAGYLVFENPTTGDSGAKSTHLLAQHTVGRLLHIQEAVTQDYLIDPSTLVVSFPDFTESVRFAPVQIGESESMCIDLSAQTEAGCGPINWYWLTADSPADLLAMSHTDAAVSGQFTPGGVSRARTVSVRSTGIAHQLIVRGVPGSDMRMQRFIARFRRAGRIRL